MASPSTCSLRRVIVRVNKRTARSQARENEKCSISAANRTLRRCVLFFGTSVHFVTLEPGSGTNWGVPSSVRRQLATSSGRPFDRSLYTHFREQHWSAVFSGVDQHLNSKPPFRCIALPFGELPNIIAGISKGSCRRPIGQADRLIEWSVPRHCVLRKPKAAPGIQASAGRIRSRRYDVLGRGTAARQPPKRTSDAPRVMAWLCRVANKKTARRRSVCSTDGDADQAKRSASPLN
jgi:hypothetical protein